jgi:hypothetical protein
MLRRSILTEVAHFEGRDFYPLLAEVGKASAENDEPVSVQGYDQHSPTWRRYTLVLTSLHEWQL